MCFDRNDDRYRVNELVVAIAPEGHQEYRYAWRPLSADETKSHLGRLWVGEDWLVTHQHAVYMERSNGRIDCALLDEHHNNGHAVIAKHIDRETAAGQNEPFRDLYFRGRVVTWWFRELHATNQCANCGAWDHKLARCEGPATPAGDIIGCPFCNRSYPMDYCQCLPTRTYDELFEALVVNRQNLPPIRTLLSIVHIAIAARKAGGLLTHMPLTKTYVRDVYRPVLHAQFPYLDNSTERDPILPTTWDGLRRMWQLAPRFVAEEFSSRIESMPRWFLPSPLDSRRPLMPLSCLIQGWNWREHSQITGVDEAFCLLPELPEAEYSDPEDDDFENEYGDAEDESEDYDDELSDYEDEDEEVKVEYGLSDYEDGHVDDELPDYEDELPDYEDEDQLRGYEDEDERLDYEQEDELPDYEDEYMY